jgi:hypothetical protein
MLAALSRVMPRRAWRSFLVTPETLLRWHRRIVACRWTHPHRPPGRPPIDQAVRELTLHLARENDHWGYVRIVGEFRKLGITVSATQVRNVLARAGTPPAPERAASSWRSFLRQHRNTILACDLFTVDSVWLRRLYVLFFVSIGTRRVEYVACTRHPGAAWMTQQARNLLMDLDDCGGRPRFLIHDRDTKFSRGFDAIFASEGIEIVRTPIQTPNANGGQRGLGVGATQEDLYCLVGRVRCCKRVGACAPSLLLRSTSDDRMVLSRQAGRRCGGTASRRQAEAEAIDRNRHHHRLAGRQPRACSRLLRKRFRCQGLAGRRRLGAQ